MPGPGAGGPSSPQIKLPDHLAETEDAIESGQVQALDFVRCGYGSMVGIEKQKNIIAGGKTMPTQSFDQPRFVPLMDEDDVGSIEKSAGVEIRLFVELRPELRGRA